MSRNLPKNRLRTLCLGAALVASLAVAGLAPARAQDARDLPDGIPLGPWLIIPVLTTDFESDTNLLRKSDNDADIDDSSDTSASVELDLSAALPFRNSLLELDVTTSEITYDSGRFADASPTNTRGKLELNFSSGYSLTLEDRFRRDYVQLSEEFSDGSEEATEDIFFGEPHNFNTWSIQLDRDDPTHQGFLIDVSREDFIYRGEVGVREVDFFERRGFDSTFEYLHPLPSNRGIVVYYNQRRLNHYDPDRLQYRLVDADGDGRPDLVDQDGDGQPDLDPNGDPVFQLELLQDADGNNILSPVGAPDRKEESDYLQVGIRGSLASTSYLFRAGYTRFEILEFINPNDAAELNTTGAKFRGISAFAYWRASIGGGSGVNLSFTRRPLPSNLSTYYISNAVRAGFDRSWASYTFDFSAGLSRNRYEDVIVGLECDGRRDDLRFDARGRVRWSVHKRFAFQASAGHERRSSNCDNADYVTSEFTAGMVLGWY